MRAYAQGERVERLRAGDFQRANGFDRHCRKKQRGIAMVEFAIAVPVLLLLMLVAAEAGRWLYQYNTLHKAVRDGVRYAASEALHGTTGVMKQGDDWLEVVQDTKNVVIYGNPTAGGNPVLPDLVTGDITVPPSVDGVHVQIDASYDYVPIFDGIPTFGFGNGPIDFDIDMTASATMRAL